MSIVVIKQASYMYNKAFDQFKTHNYLINFQNKKLFDISWTFFFSKIHLECKRITNIEQVTTKVLIWL